jgi:hypothetical protein
MKATALASKAALPFLAALALAAGCSSARERDEAEPPPAPVLDLEDGPPVVFGTVVDAASGAPVAGARVVAPDGTEATTGADGRFRLKGVAAGTAGDLVATAGPLRGAVRLRPVSGGRLEVVVHVR